MSDRDPVTEQAIKEVAEILAKGYLRLLMKPSEAATGSAAPSDTTAVEEKHALPAKRKSDQRSKAELVQPPEPLPAPPQASTATRPDVPESLRAEIAERLQKLATMNLSELRAEHQHVFNRAPRSTNRQHLLHRIAWEIQAQAEGRLPEEAREYACRVAEQTDMFRRIDEALQKRRALPTPSRSTVARKPGHRAQHGETRQRDPRIPAPGSLLIVKHGRQTVRVTVLHSGFEYAGKPYRSLTAVARQVTGRKVNAYGFFGLGPPPEPACGS
jgi:hypothetical protein